MRQQEPTIIEMAQQILKSHFIIKILGGLFPENLPPSSVHDILAIGSGVGTWSLEVATAYPDKRIIGVEPHSLLLDYAESQRLAQRLENVQFRQVQQLSHLDIADATIDLASGQFLFPRLPKENWPAILQECYRVQRPAGSISFTECTCEETNSKALLTYYAHRAEVERLTGFACHAIDTDHFIIQHLLRWLREAGYQNIQHIIKPIDASFTQAETWLFFLQNFMVQFKVLQPLMIETSIATQTELDQLYHRTLTEMRSAQFQATLHGVLVWAKKGYVSADLGSDEKAGET